MFTSNRNCHYVLYASLPGIGRTDTGYLLVDTASDGSAVPIVFDTQDAVVDYVGVASVTVKAALASGSAIGGFYIREVTGLELRTPIESDIRTAGHPLVTNHLNDGEVTPMNILSCGREWWKHIPQTVRGVTHKRLTRLWLHSSAGRACVNYSRSEVRKGISFVAVLKMLTELDLVESCIPEQEMRNKLRENNLFLPGRDRSTFEFSIGGGYSISSRLKVNMDPTPFMGTALSHRGLICKMVSSQG